VATKKKQQISAHDLDRIIVRLPEGMRDKIASIAETNGRSMTAEVVAALEQHLKAPGRLDALEAFIEKHRQMLDQMSEYVWFGEGGVLADLERLERQVSEISERTGSTHYDEMD
jgi:hypothetical protein